MTGWSMAAGWALALGAWALATSCGSTESDGGDPIDGGAAGAPSSDAAVEEDARPDIFSDVPPCPELELRFGPCGWLIVQPEPLADGGLSPAPCEISIESEVASGFFCDQTDLSVAVDCDIIPYGYGREYPNEARWDFDYPAQPTAVIFNDVLCAQVSENGFFRIDVFLDLTGGLQ